MEETLTSGKYVPFFNFKYVSMNFEKLRDHKRILEDKITQVKRSNSLIFYYSSSDNINCHSIQATIN